MQLYVREAAGDYRAAGLREILDGARACVGRSFRAGRPIRRPVDAADLFAGKRAGLDAERFAVLFLTTKHRVIAYEELFFGTLDSTSVHPREVVKRALHHHAAAVILGHNHPSGDTTPSAADEAITRQIDTALRLVEAKVLDHLIVGDGYTSLAERGSM
jgi:DNA repair protein RadC